MTGRAIINRGLMRQTTAKSAGGSGFPPSISCDMSQDFRSRHCGNRTRFRILPLIGIEAKAPS
jgi:hypothetical protein